MGQSMTVINTKTSANADRPARRRVCEKCSAVSSQSTRVTDRQTDGRNCHG